MRALLRELARELVLYVRARRVLAEYDAANRGNFRRADMFGPNGTEIRFD